MKNKPAEETVSCANCSISYLKKDIAKHKQWCSSFCQGDNSSSDQWIRSIPGKAVHGFIYQRRHLFGSVITSFESPKDLQALPLSRLRERLIFLNPTSMRGCGLKIGDHVVVIDATGEPATTATAVVWPSSKVSPFSIGIPKTTILNESRENLENRYCGVSKIPRLKSACQIRLIPTSSATKASYGSDDFVRYCRSYLDGTCVKVPEDIVRIAYFGQICIMRTISTVDDLEECVSADESTTSLTDQLSSLDLTTKEDLSESGDMIDNNSRTSTPARTALLENGIASPSTPGKLLCYQVPSFEIDQRFALINESTVIDIEEESETGYRGGLL